MSLSDSRFTAGSTIASPFRPRADGRHKSVPVHRFSVMYYFGGITLFLFVVQVPTGILLMLYYQPSADHAFESVEFMMTTVPFGWLIRSLHSWSANLMIGFAFLHLVSVYFAKAYRPPRELSWVTGCLALFLVLAFGFSGYLLPWNELALFATKVGTQIPSTIPLVGEWITRFLRGGDRVTGATLSRFFGWHVAILPALTTLLVAVHLLGVQLHGMSVPPGAEKEARPPPADAVLSPIRAARPVCLAARARRVGGPGGPVSLGARNEGRSVRPGSSEHQAGVVLHVHVPDPEDRAGRLDPGPGVRGHSHSAVRARRRSSAAGALSRPRRRASAAAARSSPSSASRVSSTSSL